MRKTKKAAFEMSMGTIVIIVLAISMLILGLVLTKKIMCSGIVLTDKIDQAVENQVASMFEGQEYGVKCLGESGNAVTLGGGGRRQVICVINDNVGGVYDISFKGITKIAGNIADPNSLVVASGWTGNVAPGKKTVTVAVLDLPQKIPNSAVQIDIDVLDPAGNTETHNLYLDLAPSSTIGSAIC